MQHHSSNTSLPDGVVLRSLKAFEDSRGRLFEMNRESWGLPKFKQQNLVFSKPNVLRGVHVHQTHIDDLLVISGKLILVLHDIRRNSSTFRHSTIIELSGDLPTRCVIPTGVAHGFYTPVSTTYTYGLSNEWSSGNYIGCSWDDPKLKLEWPSKIIPELSNRDRNPMNYNDMVSLFEKDTSQESNL
jgi:dTDP-4-dehydrorhamnose 3,5-epimerase